MKYNQQIHSMDNNSPMDNYSDNNSTRRQGRSKMTDVQQYFWNCFISLHGSVSFQCNKGLMKINLM